MKKMLCLLVAVMAVCLLSALSFGAAAEATVPTTCQACGTAQTWTVLPAAMPSEAGHYHYYLEKSVDAAQLITGAGTTICLDLNGFGIHTNGRAMIASTGSVVNVMDSSVDQTGYIQGSRGTNNTVGGTLTVQANCTFNLYSGTLKYLFDDSGHKLYRGGTVWVKESAVMNVYGGVIEGGHPMHDGSHTPKGATISVASKGYLNISGGRILSGELPEPENGYTPYAPCILAEAATAYITLSGDPWVEDIYMAAGSLILDGTFSGTAYVTSHDTPKKNLDIGTAKNTPKITGNLFCENGDGWRIVVSDSDLKLAAPTAAAHRCQHCNHMVKWTALNTTTLTNTAGEYHMYLSANYSGSQVSFAENTKVCLDLYGKTWKSSKRALYLKPNSQLNLMDTVGGGYVEATTAGNNPTGGVMVIKSGAVFNMYSGTLQLEEKYYEGAGVGTGGITYMSETGATFNLYGGTVQGVDLVISEYDLTYNGKGAAFFLHGAVQLNVYGGEITNGTLPEGGMGSCVYLNANTAKVTLTGDAKVGDIYCRYENDQVTISGTYTGSVNLSYADTVELAEGQTVAKAVNADITGAKVTSGDEWLAAVDGSNIVLVPNATAILYGETTQTFETLQEALDAFESGYIKLMRPTAENVTVSKDLLLDLNGKTVSGTVTVAEGKTLSIKDSQTDDYTVSDGIYGKLTATGNVQATDGYLLVNEDGQLSAHKYQVAITAMTLRVADAGIYYKSSFLGDEKVAATVESFGVALSVIDVPYEKNLETKCVYSTFTGFESGENGNAGASTLLKGILKDTNTDAINSRNMAMTVYGRPYLKTADGYVFGESVNRSLNAQMLAIDGMVDSLSGSQLHALKEFYNKYKTQLSQLELPNVEKEVADTTLKILGIGNSYTQDSMWMLGAVYKAEKNQDVELGIAYYSGCRLDQHVSFINGNEAVYQFNRYDPAQGKWISTNNMTLKEIIDATDWDLVSMQQGSGKSGVESSYNSDIQTIQNYVVDTLGYAPTFFWNMTWSYPQVDIPTDSYEYGKAPNFNNFKNYYNEDQEYMYQMITQTVQNKIVPDSTFKWVVPVGTAVQNMKSSYLGDLDLYRDYTHLNDYGRLAAAYTWFCRLEGVPADTFKLTYIPDALTKSYTQTGDIPLSESMMDILEESVRNACATPFQVTQSQYTEAP